MGDYEAGFDPKPSQVGEKDKKRKDVKNKNIQIASFVMTIAIIESMVPGCLKSLMECAQVAQMISLL